MLVESLNSAVGDVVVARDATEIGGLQCATSSVVSAQARLIQLHRGGVNQIRASELERGIILQRIDAHSVQIRVAKHAYVQISVPQPIHSLAGALDRAKHNLSVERVGQVVDKLGLDGQLLVQERKIVLQLTVLCDDDALTESVELGTTSTSHHLHHVLEAQFIPTALFRVVHLRALDDHRVRGKVYTPRQGGGAHQHLHVPIRKELLDQRAIRAGHTGVVDCEAVRQNVAQVRGTALLRLRDENLSAGAVLLEELRQLIVLQRRVAHRLGRLGRLLSAVDEDDGLRLTRVLHHLLVADVVHQLEPLQGLLHGDADELLLQRTRTETVVEDEQPLRRVHTEEGGDVLEVGQRRGKTDDSHHLLCRLHLSHGASHDRLQHRAAIIMQQVNLVDDQQSHQLGVRPVSRLASDDIPLLRGGDDHLRVVDLRAGQRHVAGELADVDAVGLQPRSEVAHHLRNQRLHGSDVHNLERRRVQGAVGSAM